MRVWLTQARRSSSVYAGLLIAAIDLWLALGARTQGFNLWPDLVTGLSSASLYTGAIAAGFASFEASRWTTRMRQHVQQGVRPPVVVRLAHLSAVIAPIVLGYALAILVLFVYAQLTGAYGQPYGPWLLVFAAALVAASVFGYAVGTVGNGRWYIAPLAALAFYGLFVLTRIAGLPFGFESLYPVITPSDNVFVRHIGSTMIAQTGLFLASALILAMFAGGGWRKTAQFTLGSLSVALLAIVTITAGVIVHQNGQYTTGYNSRDFVCSAGQVEICLNRGYRAAMQPLTQQFDLLAARGAGTDLVPRRLEQNVEGVGDEPAPGSRSVYIEELNANGMAFAAYRYVVNYGGTQACSDYSGDEFIAEEFVNDWLSGYQSVDPATPGISHLHNLEALSTQEANAWFRDHQEGFKTCSLHLRDLP